MRLETFSQLSKGTFKIEWIVEGLLSPGQWTYFVGPPGSGKSILAIQLCEALQEGKDFLGMKTKKHNCLYIQADAGRMEWRQQVSQLAGESFAWTMHEVDKGFVDSEFWVQYIHDTVWGTYPEDDPRTPVLKHMVYDFVVFDCLNAITEKDLNTKSAMTQVLKALEFICSKAISDTGPQKDYLRSHFMLIHHPSAMVTRGVNAGSGYKGFAGLCGNMLTLASSILVLEKNKITSKKELRLEQNRETGGWTLIASGGGPRPKGQVKYDDDDLGAALGSKL